MRAYAIAAALTLLMSPGFAMADLTGEHPHPIPTHDPGQGDDDHDDHDKDDCPTCHERKKEVCLNLKCDYEFKHHDKKLDCVAVSTFKKKVTKDGGEVSDESDQKDDLRFEVSCEGKPIWAGPARRFTGLLGTRIQGQQGPNPAITLPRGALHSNDSSEGAGHYARSVLELQTDDGWKRADGKCFIWSGNP